MRITPSFFFGRASFFFVVFFLRSNDCIQKSLQGTRPFMVIYLMIKGSRDRLGRWGNRLSLVIAPFLLKLLLLFLFFWYSDALRNHQAPGRDIKRSAIAHASPQHQHQSCTSSSIIRMHHGNAQRKLSVFLAHH